MTGGRYQPDRGDFIYLHFSPQAGTEQAGRTPAIVLSPRNFNVATGLAFVCPVTSQVKGSSFEVPIPQGAGVSGVVLSDHLRSLDWIERRVEFRSHAPANVVEEVIARVRATLAPD